MENIVFAGFSAKCSAITEIVRSYLILLSRCSIRADIVISPYIDATRASEINPQTHSC